MIKESKSEALGCVVVGWMIENGYDYTAGKYFLILKPCAME